MVTQYHKSPFEVFTIDDLYDEDKILEWKNMVEAADPRERTFTPQDFKNGKIIAPEISNFMFERIKSVLPSMYANEWEFLGPTKYVMYAKVIPGQQFGMHTDTGCEYSEGGLRISKFTVLTYLNDDFEGGKTQFFDNMFNKTAIISPKSGRTLIFDIDSFHAGKAVISGTKYWIGTELVCRRVNAK